MQITGMKLQGPETQPVSSARDAGDVVVGDLPLSMCENTGTKLEQFVDIIRQHPWNYPPNFFDDVVCEHCSAREYSKLPPPFCLQSTLPVKYTMQYIIVPRSPPDDAEPGQEYAAIIRHSKPCNCNPRCLELINCL